MIKKAKRYIYRNGGLGGATAAIKTSIKTFGLTSVVKRGLGIKKGVYTDYQNWIDNVEKRYTDDVIKVMLERATYQPKISFLIPVYNVGEKYLRECIDSIRHQYYENWELCIADDASPKPHVRRVLEEYMLEDERIKVVFREKNGHISEATNSALSIATGEYIALVDNDDVLKKEALLEIVTEINRHPNADMLYTDEDKIDEEGTERVAPAFKPGWSPDAFFSHMYLCHLGVYRRKIAEDIGGFRTAFNGSQDYDFVLRFTEKTTEIYHVPYILYHWRMLPTSTAMSGSNKDYAFDASVRAKKEALERRGYKASIVPFEEEASTNTIYEINNEDMVSILISAHSNIEKIKNCVTSIIQKSTWNNFEIIISYSSEKLTMDLEKLMNEFPRIRLNFLTEDLNEAGCNNEGAKVANGAYLMFVHPDTEIITENWMELMVGHASLPYTGAVGGRLLNRNGTVQQAGILVLDNGKKPVYAFSRYGKNDIAYFGRLKLNYNYLAIGKEALLIEKRKFDEVQGFTINSKLNYYSDIDLGLKLYEHGYFNVCRGDVEMYHFNDNHFIIDEATTKLEMDYLNTLWGEKYLSEDPFYSPNFQQEKGNFALKLKR